MLRMNYYFPIKKQTASYPPLQEVSTAAEMDALLIAANVCKAYKYTGETTADYTNGDIYIVEEN